MMHQAVMNIRTHTQTHNAGRRGASRASSKWAHNSFKSQAKKSEFVNQPNNPTFSPGIINIKHQAKCNERSDLLATALRFAETLKAAGRTE